MDTVKKQGRRQSFHSLHEYLLGTQCMAGTLLGTGIWWFLPSEANNPVADTNIPPRTPTAEVKLQPWQELKRENLVLCKAYDREM